MVNIIGILKLKVELEIWILLGEKMVVKFNMVKILKILLFIILFIVIFCFFW